VMMVVSFILVFVIEFTLLLSIVELKSGLLRSLRSSSMRDTEGVLSYTRSSGVSGSHPFTSCKFSCTESLGYIQ
jgi:hypothetical protein